MKTHLTILLLCWKPGNSFTKVTSKENYYFSIFIRSVGMFEKLFNRNLFSCILLLVFYKPVKIKKIIIKENIYITKFNLLLTPFYVSFNS